MLFGDEPRFHKDLKATFAGGTIFAHVEVIEISVVVRLIAYDERQ